MFKHVLISTDGSTLSRKAAKAGIAFAKAIGARVTVYHALETTLSYLAGDGAIIDASLIESLEKHARAQGDKCVAEIAKTARVSRVACTTYITQPVTSYQGIIAAAKTKKCDAIFMGSHGRSGVASLLLGSVTQQVLAHSKIPVIVYR